MYRNNKDKIILSSKFLALFLMLCAGIFLCLLLHPERANSGPYLDSAHGNSTYGVKRNATGFPTDYSRGNCAHCHEEHASIGGAEPQPVDGAPSNFLLASDFVGQLNIFCYDCHTETNQLQDPSGPMNQQYNYSRMAGGDTTITCPDNIARAFVFVDGSGNPRPNNCGSSAGTSHFLFNIANFLVDKWGFGSIAGDIDPCSGCHNPHRAQRDTHITTGRTDGVNLIVSSVSLPSKHNKDNTVWDLWGDESGERMSDYAGGITYQAPYRYNSTITYEPDGSAIQNGTNLFDVVTFCTDCHNTTNTIISTRLGALKQIDWSPNGDVHGLATQVANCICDYGDKTAPYPVDPYVDPNPPFTPYPNHVLSCLDCHEPHGSPNEYLLRQEVNGVQIPNITTSGQWWFFCTACHQNLANWSGTPFLKHAITPPTPIGPTSGCFGCHWHGRTYPLPGSPRCAPGLGCAGPLKIF